MKTRFAPLLLGSVLLIAGTAFADDMSKPGMSQDAMAKHAQKMKDCMDKQDSSMSKDAAKKACEDKMKKDAMSKGHMSKMGPDAAH